jgi:hypothetical protein
MCMHFPRAGARMKVMYFLMHEEEGRCKATII